MEGRKIKLKPGRAVSVHGPCVIILPEDSRIYSVVLHVIADGHIDHHAAPIDDRPERQRKPR
jgi:hypothetical protein